MFKYIIITLSWLVIFQFGIVYEKYKQSNEYLNCKNKYNSNSNNSYYNRIEHINKFYKHKLTQDKGFDHAYNHIKAFTAHQMYECLNDRPMFGEK